MEALLNHSDTLVQLMHKATFVSVQKSKQVRFRGWHTCFVFIACILLGSQARAQASLPLSRTSWTGSEPTGWSQSGTSDRTTSFACSGNNGAIFDNTGDWVIVNFNAAPDQLVFKLKKSSMSGESKLTVARSDDGSTYTTLGEYGTASGATAITDCADITLTLTSGTRYVRWTYTKATGNCDFDDVSISAGTSEYYWNGGNISSSPANGGTGTWSTSNAWRQPTASGSQATWT
ncbi:MAG: hypothetical protein K1X77_11130, partial [Bacteroidia bacterium]|nr:hypothetical protein [Bacteroidia bacterium]